MRTAGCIMCGHLRAAAVAAAVPGPPTLAFEAVRTASMGSRSMRLPPTMTATCVISCTAMRQNSHPMLDSASRLPAAAPIVAKNGSSSAAPRVLLPAASVVCWVLMTHVDSAKATWPNRGLQGTTAVDWALDACL